MSIRSRRVLLGLALSASLLWLQAQPANGFAPNGACCLGTSSCIDVVEAMCEERAGAYIGDGTTCAEFDCSARIAAPVFSILGMVGVVGALGGFGVYRLIRKKR